MDKPDAGVVRELLGLPAPTADVSVEVLEVVQIDGGRRMRLQIACPDGDEMPAFLLVPDGVRDAPGVVVFHQHAGQWHLGKSEVCGLAGDPTQAFGRALVDAGLVVLTPDAVGFEDRRRTTSGTDPHPDDRDQYDRELAYRLLGGQTLAAKVITDARLALGALRVRRSPGTASGSWVTPSAATRSSSTPRWTSGSPSRPPRAPTNSCTWRSPRAGTP